MTLNEYQKEAAHTSGWPTGVFTGEKEDPAKGRLYNALLGLCGESGEVADLFKKVLGHGHPYTTEMFAKVQKELGDVLWYVAEMASVLGMTLEDIAGINIAKLRARYPQGFTTHNSVNRKEGDA